MLLTGKHIPVSRCCWHRGFHYRDCHVYYRQAKVRDPVAANLPQQHLQKNHPTGLHSSRILCTLGQDLCMFFSSKTLSKILLYFPLPHGKECFCTSLACAPQHGGDLAAFLLGSTVCKNTPVSRGTSGSRLWCANLTAKPRARRPPVKCVLTIYHRTLH